MEFVRKEYCRDGERRKIVAAVCAAVAFIAGAIALVVLKASPPPPIQQMVAYDSDLSTCPTGGSVCESHPAYAAFKCRHAFCESSGEQFDVDDHDVMSPQGTHLGLSQDVFAMPYGKTSVTLIVANVTSRRQMRGSTPYGDFCRNDSSQFFMNPVPCLGGETVLCFCLAYG